METGKNWAINVKLSYIRNSMQNPDHWEQIQDHMHETEPVRIKQGAGLRSQGVEANMMLPWVTVLCGGKETVGSQETQTESFQLDCMGLAHGYLTWEGEKRKGRTEIVGGGEVHVPC